ncbi:hypothetical protein [Tritonibacter mobilis]|uniref:hypothetical protein n=1 Tax=Tritonibacter mobilis TaxID=379347 RepID=UPI000806D426|nr:hypothetical protein [Tritonibacter mobilis]
MINSEFLAILEQFQTTIVGIVGFIGVIWTLRANAKNAREEHGRQIGSRRTALRRILAAEFRNYRRALKKNLEAQPPNDGLLSVGRIHRLFSEQIAADLGLLDLDEIDVVVNALISLDGMDHFLENISLQTSDTRFLLSSEAWEEFQIVNSTTADALNYAVQALEFSGEA